MMLDHTTKSWFWCGFAREFASRQYLGSRASGFVRLVPDLLLPQRRRTSTYQVVAFGCVCTKWLQASGAMPSNRRSSRSRRPPEVYHPTTRVSGFGSQPRSQAGAGAGAGAGSGSSAKPRRRGRRALAALDDDVAMDSDEGGAEPVVTSSDDDSGDDDDFSPDASSAKRRTSTARSASKQKSRGSAKKTSTARSRKQAAAAVGEDQVRIARLPLLTY